MQKNQFNSIFSVLGPKMIGPSSSHTAGVTRLAKLARLILNHHPEEATIFLGDSLYSTGKGHSTDKGILAGLMGLNKDDIRITKIQDIINNCRFKYKFKKLSQSENKSPNAIKFILKSSMLKVELTGETLGGGLIAITNIDGFDLYITGNNHTLLITHYDRPNLLLEILKVVSEYKLNIAGMNSYRKKKSKLVKTSIEFDENIPNELSKRISGIKYVTRTRLIPILNENW